MVDFYDGVKGYIRICCFVVIETVVGSSICMNIKAFYCSFIQSFSIPEIHRGGYRTCQI